MLGTLYVVATPIGNLQDVTLRAIKILSEVDIVLCEDTRVTKKLLASLNFQFPISKFQILSYHQHSREDKKFLILKNLVEGKKIALITDAGTPGISDPGNELIDFILSKEPLIPVIPIPGASSITAALSVCGMNVSKFIFVGFLPKKGRHKLFSQVKNLKLPLIFFESPKRIIKTLGLLAEQFGEDRRIFIARELTKLHETLYRGTIAEVKKQFAEMKSVKGELVVVLEAH